MVTYVILDETHDFAVRTDDVAVEGTCGQPDDPTADLDTCGFPAGSFACRVTHDLGDP